MTGKWEGESRALIFLSPVFLSVVQNPATEDDRKMADRKMGIRNCLFSCHQFSCHQSSATLLTTLPRLRGRVTRRTVSFRRQDTSRARGQEPAHRRHRQENRWQENGSLGGLFSCRQFSRLPSGRRAKGQSWNFNLCLAQIVGRLHRQVHSKKSRRRRK